jgi:tRNA threonylcarbamoyladenosine biosynthesis protein TsaB
LLLAIDTATRFMSVALFDGERIIAEQTVHSRHQQTVHLTAVIDQLLKFTGAEVGELTALAIAEGPGSFSGLRVGFGVAKGLAMARHIPLIPVPTLDIIARASPFFEGRLLAVVQAGRGRIIAGVYDWLDGRWQSDAAPQITTWEALIAQNDGPVMVNGEIDAQGREALTQSDGAMRCTSAGERLRRAGFLAELGWTAFQQGDYPDDATEVNPIYLKEP